MGQWVSEWVGGWGGVGWDRCVSGVQTFQRNTVPSPSRVKQSMGNCPTGYFSWTAWSLTIMALHTLPMTQCHIPKGLNPQQWEPPNFHSTRALMGTYGTYYKPIYYNYRHSHKEKQRGHDLRCMSQPKCVILGHGQLNRMWRRGSWRMQHNENWKTFCWTLFSKWVKWVLIKCPLTDTYHVTKLVKL